MFTKKDTPIEPCSTDDGNIFKHKTITTAVDDCCDSVCKPIIGETTVIYGLDGEKGEAGANGLIEYVPNYSNLLEFTEEDEIVFGYPVTVGGLDDFSKLGIWYCINPNDLSNPLSWVRANEPVPFNQVIRIGTFSLNELTYIATLDNWAFNENGFNYEPALVNNLVFTAPDLTFTKADIVVWDSVNGYAVISGTPAEDYSIPNTPTGTILVQTIVRNVDGSITPSEPDLSNFVTINTSQNITAGKNFQVGIKTYTLSNTQGIYMNGGRYGFPDNADFLFSVPNNNEISLRALPSFANVVSFYKNNHSKFYGTVEGSNPVIAQDFVTKAYGDANYLTAGGAVDSVNAQVGVVVLDADDISDTVTVKKFVTASDITKLANTSGTNTGDQDISGKLDKTASVVNSLSNGVITGGKLTVNGSNPARFDISDGSGVIIDSYTNPLSPVVYNVSWTGLTNQVVTNIATQQVTYVYISNTGAAFQSNVPPTPQLRRDYILLGQLGHTNNTTLGAAVPFPDVLSGTVSSLRDISAVVGSINFGNVVSSNGANLNINKSSGILTRFGINFYNDNKNPNEITTAATIAGSFRYRTRTGNGATNTTLIDPANYDVGGVITPLSGTKATNQRVFLNVNNNVVIQYGQSQYNNITTALANAQSESFTLFPNLNEGFVLIGVITVLSNATSLNNTNQAIFTRVSKFGEITGATAGLSTTTLQQAYSNSVEPEILTDSAHGAVSVRRGSTADTDNVFELLNGAGTITASVKGNGEILGSNLSGTNTGDQDLSGLVPYTGAVSDVNLGEFGIQLGNLEFDNTPTTIPTTAGSLYWNDTDGTLDLKLKGGNVTLQVGQEQLIRVVNKTGLNLTEAAYSVVYLSGAQGQRPKVDLALSNNSINSAATLGLVTENINNNLEGFITTSGLVRGINTTGSLQGETWVDGNILYVSATVAGKLTNIMPVAPNHKVIVGYIISAHATQGTIFVKVSVGQSIAEINDVDAAAANNKEGLFYDSATQTWKHKTVATVLGYTPVNPTRLINTTSPLLGGGDLSADRTLSIQQAATSQAGFLTATDWNTFNGKQAALGYTPYNPANNPVNTGGETLQSVTNRGNIVTFTSGRAFDTNSDGVLFAKNGGLHNIIFGDGNVRYYSLFTPSGAAYGSIRNFSTNTDILSFTSAANVGIGITAPTEKLHVVGNGLFSGNIRASSIGIGAAANAAAYITTIANTASVGQLYLPPSATDYTGTLSGMTWNNASEWKFYDGVLGTVNRFIKLNGNSILTNSNALNVVTSTGTGGNLGTLKVETSFSRYPTAVSYTVLLTDIGFGWIIAVTSTAAARTITLPLANVVPAGFQLTIKDESGAAGTNAITIARSNTDLIDGATSVSINTNYGSRTLYSDGVTKWFII